MERPAAGEGLRWKWLKPLPASDPWSQDQNLLRETYLELPMPERGMGWSRVTSASKEAKTPDLNLPWTPPYWVSGPWCPRGVGRKEGVPEP